MTTEQKKANRTLDFNGFPGYWEIRKTTEEANGEVFETKMKLEEPGKLPPHRHPIAEESYEVLTGEMEVYAGGEWLKLTAGEKHTVPPDKVHAFRNKGPVEVLNIHKPALKYEEYFRRFHQLKTKAGVEMPPKGIRAMTLLAMLQVEYEREFISSNPPQWLFRLLAGLGRLLGYKIPE